MVVPLVYFYIFVCLFLPFCKLFSANELAFLASCSWFFHANLLLLTHSFPIIV